MRTLIKFCGITSADDARFAAEAGADYLGFIFVPGTPRAVAPETVREIVRDLPPEVKKVGVFRDAPDSDLRRIMEFCGLDIVQLHGRETPETAAALAEQYEVWKALPFTTPASAALARDFPGCTILADGDKNGGGCDWTLARRAARSARVILAGGITGGNAAAAIAAVRPAGVDLCSGAERSPGVKDHGKILEIINRVRRADLTPDGTDRSAVPSETANEKHAL